MQLSKTHRQQCQNIILISFCIAWNGAVISSGRHGGQTVSETVKFLLRAPKELWEEIKQWADEEDRSVNQQVVHILRKAVSERRKPTDQ